MNHTFRSALLLLAAAAPLSAQRNDPNDLSAQVEILRTTYGVPHIRADNLRAFGYGLAWVQQEDYGTSIAMGMLRGRGDMGKVFGRDSMETDFIARPRHARAREVYHLLDQDTRDVYEGFAAGLNRYITLHPADFAPGFPTDFSGYDVAARDIEPGSVAVARRFAAKVQGGPARPGVAAPGQQEEGVVEPNPNEGSNAWALGPSRTKSKKAILLRNPHLQWDAGYYEAHATVPGKLDFYGDFRIGGPFTVIGGFNKDLGWATTNNNSPQDAIYALDVFPGATDAIWLDGTEVPLTRQEVTVEFRNGAGFSSESREEWESPIGPVIARAGGKVYVLRHAAEGEYRGGEQFLRMMQATSLAEWRAAMRVNARTTSNFTYADRAGNIFYVWNAALPAFPHSLVSDTIAIPVSRTSEVWTKYVPWDSLPHLLNPKGGYTHNENDPPHFTNLLEPMDPARLPVTVPPPSLSLRSQMALQLLTTAKPKLTLDDVIRLKHSYHMLLADRVKPDLLGALRAAADTGLGEAVDILAKWDNTAAPDSRGGVLFEAWWRRYVQAGGRGVPPFAVAWSKDEPTSTPRGLADAPRAVTAMKAALPQVRQKYGRADVSWGEVHRVRMGGKDVPVGGCGGDLGCFRVLQFSEDPDGKLVARGGDGWILAVEFGDVPKAMSVLAYGESQLPTSPWNTGDQGVLFARAELKPVAFLAKDVDATVVRRYRPGAP